MTTSTNNNLIHVVSFSGGRTSAFMVWLMERARKEFGWDVRYIFCDTGVEHPQTYRFIRDIVKHWGIDLTILRAVVNPTLGEGNSYQIFKPSDLMTPSMPPFQPFMDMMIKYGTPTALGAYCSERMKKDVADAYCKDHIGTDYVTWLGIRGDEPNRLKRKSGIKYLANLTPAMDKQDVLDWWKYQDFDLGITEESGNCLFCVKKSTLKIALAAKRNPGFLQQWKYHLNQSSIREKSSYDKKVMYRGKLSLEGIATMYLDTPEVDILKRMRNSKQLESGSCTESCEAFNPTTRETNYNIVNKSIYRDFEANLKLQNFEKLLETA